MGTLMKTTIEISDALFDEAKRHAKKRGTTLRALVEEGLRTVLDSRPDADDFTLRDASIEGKGLRPELCEGDWDRIAQAAYASCAVPRAPEANGSHPASCEPERRRTICHASVSMWVM